MKLMALYRKLRGIDGDTARAAVALIILAAASLACVSSGGDEAPASIFATTNATITGTTLPGARVATDRGEYSTTADASGAFSLSVAGGVTYNIFSTANGYKTVVVQGTRPGVGSSLALGTTVKPTQLLAANERTYVGSSQCKLCHATQYNRWANSPHRYGLSSPGDSPGILATPKAHFEAGTSLRAVSSFSSPSPDTAPILTKSGDTYYVSIGACSYPVTYTMGYQWKQRFLTKIGNAHYILPIQYNTATGQWVSYSPTNWYDTWQVRYTSQASLETSVYKMNSWERKCMGCHSVSGILSLAFSASTTSGIEQHNASWVEKGVGCEACHGPASAHVWGNGALGTTADPYVVNPSKLSVDRRVDVCGQCHSRGLSVGKLYGQAADSFNATNDTYSLEYYYDGTRTFRPGDTLVAFYTDGGGYWNDSVEIRTSSSHHQQWNDFQQSGHMMPNVATSVSCGSCHDVHGPIGNARQLKLSATDNSLCLACHGPNGAANQRFTTDSSVLDHMGTVHTTYNPSGTGTGRCVTCHMPATATSATAYDIHAHTFRSLRPHNTNRMTNLGLTAVPNGCATCHSSVTARSLSDSYNSYIQHPMNKARSETMAIIAGKVIVTGASAIVDTFGAWVSVQHTDKGVRTSRDGSYEILVDSPGTYVLVAMMPGRESAQLSCTITATSSRKITGQNLTLPAAGGNALTRPTRCFACHGGNYGAQWRNSSIHSILQSQVGTDTDNFTGHNGHAGLTRNWSTTSCNRCHEASLAIRALTSGDTTYTGSRGQASQEQQTCEVCHVPHTAAGMTNSGLRQYRTTAYGHKEVFDSRAFAYTATDSLFAMGSMPYPASYKAATCFMCHAGRQAYGPLTNGMGVGIRTSGSDSVPVTSGSPHYTIITGGVFFGVQSDTSRLCITFDSITYGVSLDSYGRTIDTPANSAHIDSWGQLYNFQAYVYKTSPKFLSRGGAPINKTNERFTCISCHMSSNEDGTYGSGTWEGHDAGHTWKADVRACGVCHDPNYTNPLTNNLRGLTDTGGWGTSWGISSSGAFLGIDRTARGDYDGNGTIESYKHEIHGLYHRVVASLSNGNGDTYSENLKSLIGASGSDSCGHTYTSSGTFSKFAKHRALMGQVTADEMRAMWNAMAFYRATELNGSGYHNVKFEVQTLRNTWRALGRQITGNAAWNPPGAEF